jgi:hypothetical protein
MSATTDLKKLTVPQLKALCKDKKITGYSKLGKNAIIQKLVEHAGSSVTSNLNTSGSSDLPPNSTSTSVVVTPPLVVASPRVTSPTADVVQLAPDPDPKHASLPPGQHVVRTTAVIDQNQTLQKQNTSPREPTTRKTLAKLTNNDATTNCPSECIFFVVQSSQQD